MFVIIIIGTLITTHQAGSLCLPTILAITNGEHCHQSKSVWTVLWLGLQNLTITA